MPLKGGGTALLLRLHGHHGNELREPIEIANVKTGAKPRVKKPKVKSARTAEEMTKLRVADRRGAGSVAKAKLAVDRFSVEDLVLPVSGSYDPSTFDLDAYDDFINEVVAGREYSREAIRKALIFLVGGQYGSTRELAEQAFASVPAIERRYGTVEKLVERLPFPDKLSCSLDLATGTGKSFVMFCLARIMLNEGIVDRVLVLCPSRTIESGLIDKFDAMLADSDLTALLPRDQGRGCRSASTRPAPSRKGRSASRTSTRPTRRQARRSATASADRARRRSSSPTRRTTSTPRPARR